MKNNNNELITANVKMEECYSGLSLTFDGQESVRAEIEFAICKIKEKTNLSPFICTNSKDEKKQSIYLEFSDGAPRECRNFFQILLSELKIDKCVNETIQP